MPRTRHGTLGHAVAAGLHQEPRSRRHQYPQHQLAALAPLADAGKPLPFTSFSEFNKGEGGDVWFALDESRPLAFFAGLHVPQWTSVRKVKNGEETRVMGRGEGAATPLPDDRLIIVGRGVKEDAPAALT